MATVGVRMRKSYSANFQVYQCNSSSSDTSASSSSSSSDTPLRRFNRLLRSSVARHWAYFRRYRGAAVQHARGRSMSDVGLCTIVDNDPDLAYLAPPDINQRRSFQGLPRAVRADAPTLYLTSAGGSTSALGAEDPSDCSDVDRPRKSHHLRVPTPAYAGQSTGNFAAGAGAGGCGSPRSAPATPLQLEPHHRPPKHDKQAVKPLSSSAPSVRVSALANSSTGGGGDPGSDASEGKAPSKARQKKFLRHFPQVGPEERVLNYYSCALVGDILLQGHLYITKNYFAFYSNVFGYVTKLLIPTVSVVRVSKEKMARIIPNAVGVCTRDERHVFGSLLSRDSTHKLMTRVWKAARIERPPPPPMELRISEAELDASEYSPEDESSSGGGEHHVTTRAINRRDSEAIVTGPGAAVIQPALLTGTGTLPAPRRRGGGGTTTLMLLASLLLAISAAWMAINLYSHRHTPQQEELSRLSGAELYSEVARWRARLHARAASELQAFLSTNLLLLTKVRQSLEALSGVILTDMANSSNSETPPNDTSFS